MSLEESDIDSDHLSNLDTSLDEDQILESLSRLRLEIFRIETTTGPSRPDLRDVRFAYEKKSRGWRCS
jgi:hypothetical protein